jgi:DNA-binding Xre family transcriptional regulator
MARLQVKELAQARGLNISQLLLLANRLSPHSSLSYPTLHALWHNKTQRPDLDTLSVVARALAVEPGTLIVGDDALAAAEGEHAVHGDERQVDI